MALFLEKESYHGNQEQQVCGIGDRYSPWIAADSQHRALEVFVEVCLIQPVALDLGDIVHRNDLLLPVNGNVAAVAHRRLGVRIVLDLEFVETDAERKFGSASLVELIVLGCLSLAQMQHAAHAAEVCNQGSGKDEHERKVKGERKGAALHLHGEDAAKSADRGDGPQGDENGRMVDVVQDKLGALELLDNGSSHHHSDGDCQ